MFNLFLYHFQTHLQRIFLRCNFVATYFKKFQRTWHSIDSNKALTFFDKFLDYENEGHVCFICGKKIPSEELSRDHVIPWSYMYSDDLWNLVYVHKGCNSSKSNATPTIDEINKLKERNLKLQSELHEVWQDAFGNKNAKILQEFDYAIEHDYVDKFYLGCRGC